MRENSACFGFIVSSGRYVGSYSRIYQKHLYISPNVCNSIYCKQLNRTCFHFSHRLVVPKRRQLTRPNLVASFDSLVSNKTLLENISKLGYETPLPIQTSAIPSIKQGLDVTLGSHTGSGKTLAFLLPILEGIHTQQKRVQVLIIEPTRELCVQVASVCASLCNNMGIRSVSLIGGANVHRQMDGLKEKQPHIVLGTPGRLYELAIEKHVLNAAQASVVVVDEVDQCLDSRTNGGELEALLQACSSRKQTIFCSATCSSNLVVEASQRFQRDAVVIGSQWTSNNSNNNNSSPENIQHFMIAAAKHKHLQVVRQILFANPLPSAAIIFVNDQHRAKVIASKLQEFKLKVTCMQGNQSKLERAKVLKDFRQRKYPILVCTEVLARGMDFPFVSHVIQLELPTDAQHYLHRAGRCGRAGVAGFCFSIVSPEYSFVVKKFSKALNIAIHSVEIKNNKLFHQGKEWSVESNNLLPPSKVHQDESLPSASKLEAEFDQLVKELEEAETWEDVDDIVADEDVDTVTDDVHLKKNVLDSSQEKVASKKKKKKTAKAKKRLSEIAKRQGWVGNR